jgi:hypothetical protein
VRADAGAQTSDWSNTVSVSTKAPGPEGPTLTLAAVTNITGTGATVNGSVNPNGSATTYVVEYGPTFALGQSTVPISAGGGNLPVPAAVPLSGLAPNALCYYRLRATNTVGTIMTGIDTFTTADPIAAPILGNLHGTVFPNGLVLAWYEPSDLETGFTLQYRKAASWPWQELALPANTQIYTLSNLAPSTSYEIRIRADAGARTSDWSNVIATTTTPAAVTAPSAFLNPLPPYVITATETTATLSVEVAPDALHSSYIHYLEYGTTESLGSYSSFVQTTAPTSTLFSLSGLTPGTRYY